MHLTETELIDLLDGTLDAARATHVECCADCREQSERVRATLAELRAEPALEPSPLFWDAFPRRVNAALDEPARTARWSRRPAIAALTCAVLLLTFALVARRAPVEPAPVAPAVVRVPDTAPEPIDDVDADGAWAVVRAAADGLEYDDVIAEGLSAPPGAAEAVAMELSDAERAELVRLIEREISRSGA